jgi:hypothetical protein
MRVAGKARFTIYGMTPSAFLLPRIHTDGHGWICFFPSLIRVNQCSSVVPHSSFFISSTSSRTGTPACEFWISEGYRISGGANRVDQLRLDVVHAGQTVSAGRVLFSRHAEFFFYHGFTQMDTDGFAFFPSFMCCGTATRLTCWRTERISGRCRRSWAMPAWRRP